MRIHHSRAVLDFCRNNTILVKVLLPYSPQLNPIVEFFQIIKSRFYGINEGNVQETLSTVLKNNLENECSDLYRSMERWLEKARPGLPF